jgi:hypothetical protein
MIIGFGHRKRAGKDEAASALVDGANFASFSFAGPLKRGLMEIFDLSEEQVYGDLKEVVDERWGHTPRHLLQHAGTNLFRAWIPDIWVRRTIMVLGSGDYVIPDVRFPNEAQAIKDAGGIVVKVDRPSLPPLTADSHDSETALADYRHWDAVIVNDGSLHSLHMKAIEVWHEAEKGRL